MCFPFVLPLGSAPPLVDEAPLGDEGIVVTVSRIQPGSMVWYAAKGLGQVTSVNDRPAVVFWADGKTGSPVTLSELSLTPLADAEPTAGRGAKDSRFESWAKNSPLKLVAVALAACGGTGTDAQIREKLDGRAPLSPNWGSWWKRTLPKLGSLPDHFGIGESGGTHSYTLLSGVEAVPPDLVRERSATLADWREWLSSDTHGPAPGRFPTKPVANALGKWPEESIGRALLRVILSSEEALSTGGASAQAAEGWLRAVAQASLSWREVDGNDPRGYTAARVGEILARLARAAGDRTPHELLLQAGALDGATDAWRRGFLAGMWEAFESEDAREMYRNSSSILGRQARIDLARQTALAAFGPESSSNREAQLDRMLDALPEDERTQLLEEIIARASTAQREGVLGYIASSRHASGNERLPLRIVAVLMLSEGQGQLASRTSWELAESLAAPDAYGPEVASLYENTAARVEAIIAYKAGNVEELKENHEGQLERERQEQERLRQQVRERNAELAAHRAESRLELRQDMLLAIGEVLQSVNSVNTGPERNGLNADVAAGLVLALRAGGAEPLGEAGERVPYNPDVHSIAAAHSNTEVHPNAEEHSSLAGIPRSGTVKIVAPGVVYRGGTHGDRVLLKALVKHEAG